MGIWIRSQERTFIENMLGVYVCEKAVLGVSFCGSNITLGKYDTNGRALMVLDDIQKEIVRQGLMHTEEKYHLSLPDIVFQMPMR